jgi:glycerol kinase
LLQTRAVWAGAAAESAVEGSVFSAGAAVECLRDVGIVRKAAECGRLAASVPDTGGVYFVPAFTGLGGPDWDPAARGTVLGLTRGTGRAHLCRAVLEAIAHQSRDLFALMCRETGIQPSELRVDGGVARSDLLLQIQADLLGVPVVRSRQPESTALGAALLAGAGIGLWRNRAEIRRRIRDGRRFLPEIGASERTLRARRWRRAVERALRWELGEPVPDGDE